MKYAVDRYVEGLLRRRRPQPFAAAQDDLVIVRVAIELATADPDSAEPSEEFVGDLRRRIVGLSADESAEKIQPRKAGPARRRFLWATAMTATGAAAAGVCIDRLLLAPQPSDEGPGGQAGASPAAKPTEIIPLTGAWQTVAMSADLSEGSVLSFDLGSVTGFVRRVSGSLQAVSGICTHQGCQLNLNDTRNELVCPCHGASFALSGRSLTHPHGKYALSPLPRLAVRSHEDQIQVYAPVPGSPAAR